ncbi:hypothetical protein Lesp02_15820 [Lentzea sp. NBRC 105346]|uniref:hypothetical protein n=1 Tax=Lentzea sp. NBRC 105346 TaxID=3032205 RepID=UPI0024A41B3B|nr:hypothetical protein [Lentzea sp. NBRC 105346]GLZ29392.1 hypothetical protein Lesp02_15820 [Lentzea sp. NBRC 105346]
MIVQWCIKGMSLPDDDAAKALITGGYGLICNWWRDVGQISPPQVRDKLTPGNLNFHVNHFTVTMPDGRPFSSATPFISLSAGVVERDVAMKTNIVRRARRTALWFGTDFGRVKTAYLYRCWMVLAPRAAVSIEGVAEEVRDLNTYRRYSDFQTEGEIAAKVNVPANQIESCEKWVLDVSSGPAVLSLSWVFSNPLFVPPDQLSNIREVI